MTNRDSDEINLLKIVAGISFALKKNITLIIILSLLGFLFGLSSTFVFIKQYESKMLLRSDILTFSYAEKLTKTLKGLIDEQNIDLLKNRLNLTSEQAAKITDIKIEEGLEKTDELKETEKNYLVLTVRTKDPSILTDLQKGITKYFESNDFVKVRVKQKKDNFQQLINEVQSQIKSLEDLQLKINAGTFLENSKGPVMFDLTTVNTKIIELTKEKLNYQNNLELVNSIEVIEGFTPFNKPVTGRKFTSSFVGLFVGAFIALVIIALKELNNSIKKLEPAA